MKNKKVLIISSVISVIVLTTIILGILYFTTDLFKTNQQLFYKYIAQVKIVDSNFIAQSNKANDRIINNNNSSNLNLDVLAVDRDEGTATENTQSLLKLLSNSLKDVALGQLYRDFTVSSNNQIFLKLKYLKDGNIHGLLADNIVAKYLAIENSNLKEFFSKLGVQDTTNIPNSIPTNYEEILKINETMLNYLKETYGRLIYNNINKENFYKISNEDKTQIIGVSLTEQEIINVFNSILETAKNDNALLNLMVARAQLLNYNNLTIEDIQTGIQTVIDNINSKTYSTEKDFIKFSLVKKEKNIVGIIVENNILEMIDENKDSTNQEVMQTKQKRNIKIGIDFSEKNKIILLIKENDIQKGNIEITYNYDNNNIVLNANIEIKEEEITNKINALYQVTGYQTDNINQSCIIDISSTDENYKINLTNNIALKQDVQISKLTTENSALLNSMTSEELSQLFTALINRIMVVYGENMINLQ